MFGFILGALGAVAVYRISRYRRYGSRWGRGGGRGFARSMMLNRLSERLDASPAQEKVMREVADAFEKVSDAFRGEWQKTREAASKAAQGESFDPTELRSAFTRHDQVIAELRVAAVDGLRKLHEALEPKQRQELADILANGFGGCHGGFHRHHRRGFGRPSEGYAA